MTWVRLDDGFYQHPKVIQAGAIASAMQVAALCYCNRNLTDGIISRLAVPLLVNLEGTGLTWEQVAGRLVEVGLWEYDMGDGYLIHDYEKYQPTRAKVSEERAKKQAAGQAGGQASAKARAESDGQAKSNPVPKPVPVPKRDERDESTETFLPSKKLTYYAHAHEATA